MLRMFRVHASASDTDARRSKRKGQKDLVVLHFLPAAREVQAGHVISYHIHYTMDSRDWGLEDYLQHPSVTGLLMLKEGRKSSRRRSNREPVQRIFQNLICDLSPPNACTSAYCWASEQRRPKITAFNAHGAATTPAGPSMRHSFSWARSRDFVKKHALSTCAFATESSPANQR
jgi:hypothetical protein